ncbi:MAG: PBP1A family penicillin-binding protein [Elusimicrobiales bacterium]|jgi:penicillin-binding protein 1A|nr:PBP1A family penicillin-binding protein [Elusimicrobiales bacterium]
MKFFKEMEEMPPHRLALRLSYLAALVFAVLALTAAFIGRSILYDIPSIDKLDEYTPSLTTYVYDINEDIIAEFSIEKRALLTLAEIPVDLQNAVIAMEDRSFFRHWGISPRGIMRALMRDLLHTRKAQGGSTITQQLSRGIFLKPEKTVARKVREVVLALQIERNFSKQEILQMYLNQIYLGSGVYGVQSAAKLFFGKDVKDLTLPECAMLAGVIPSPERFSPFRFPDRARVRRQLVLQSMRREGYITDKEMEEALKEPLPDTKSSMLSGRAPYFIEYVRQQLEPKYGVSQLWKGGLRIYTTLDLRMQAPAEEIMEKYLAKYDEDTAKLAKPEPAEGEVLPSTAPLQGAFIILDVRTGAIKALIGGRNYRESQFNRATQAQRQAGSTFKPFVWMSALMSGYTPASIVDDLPLAYYYDGKDWRLFEGATDQYSIDLAIQPFVGSQDFKIWVPNNFDGKFQGNITLRRALEQSRNLSSVSLVNRIGPSLVVDVAHKAGIASRLDAVPSVGLGTSLVNPLEMVSSFATFGNGGIHVKPFGVLRVVDNRGKVLEEHVPSETESFSPQASYLLVNMMKGVVQRGTGVRASSIRRPLAAKTGTSQDSKDMWFIGMTPDLAAGAWMGYDDFTSLPIRDWSSSQAVAWWAEIMAEVLKDQPARDFPVPEGVVFATIDQDTGKLALPGCKKRILEAFLKGTEPQEFCDVQH